MPFLPGDGWDDTNYWSADDPGNGIGNPPGGAMDGGAGSGNFQFAAPVLGLPGRGIDISLGLAYNSRLWNKAGSQISYDIDRSWPAPGFSLGFGKLFGMGGGSILIDADGTRHPFTGNISNYSWGQHFVGQRQVRFVLEKEHIAIEIAAPYQADEGGDGAKRPVGVGEYRRHDGIQRQHRVRHHEPWTLHP